MKRLFHILLLLIFIPVNASAGLYAGRITKTEGRVKILTDDNLRGEIVRTTPEEIPVNSRVKTYRKSKAFVILSEKTHIVLLEKSVLFIENSKTIDQENGTILYKIKKYGGTSGITVKTPVSIIGVKGTMFAVTVNRQNADIFLKKGSLSIRSPEKEFEVYRLKTLKEFSDFQKEFKQYQNRTMEEFKNYKKKIQEEFLFYTREFVLPPGKSVSIKGNKVYIKDTIPEEIEENFKLFEYFGGSQ
ncbi:MULTISPECIES: FecR domain-containing protein [unclassified Desulfurobacterium]|uniref:FecR domain-containing protein n=1 Tax=Desulfurobacterium sp. TC5-1 TaxID=1158318 RepID=UPI0003B48718|nr:FecR domain-containing protein [Desulfurobacterium sp. TC5-1]